MLVGMSRKRLHIISATCLLICGFIVSHLIYYAFCVSLSRKLDALSGTEGDGDVTHCLSAYIRTQTEQEVHTNVDTINITIVFHNVDFSRELHSSTNGVSNVII